jgi:hypothetical protein
MSASRFWIASTALIVGVVGFVAADEPGKQSPPTPQKAIADPVLDGLVGSWTTESTAVHEGKESKGKGKSTFTKGIGGTAILQTYESTGTGPDGKTMTYHGHGIYRMADDGKTLNVWWFCNMNPDVMQLTGSTTADGLEFSGPSPMGGTFKLSLKKTADGVSVDMGEGAHQVKETYKRAK